MSNSLDLKYAKLASHYLSKFKNTKPGHYNFRCPYCGDSKQDENKARGWFYTYKGKLKFKCFNCEHTESSIMRFLKAQIPSLYSSYLLDITRGKSSSKKKTDVKYTPSKKLKQFKANSTSLNLFKPVEHDQIASEYLINRGIEDLTGIYCTDRFKKISNILSPGKFADENEYGKQYVIFPLLNEEGKMFGYQGRSITPCKKAFRFITIILDEDETPIYGREKIDPNKTVFVVEGPIDSLFLDNCVALCGAKNNIKLNYKKVVFVLDPDTRNNDIKDRIKELIDRKESVVILPRKFSGMDINDLVLCEYDVKKLIKNYTFSGLRAKLELGKWKRNNK